MKKLTEGQAVAMYVLLQGRAVGRLVRGSKVSSYTTDAGELAPWNLRVHPVAARALVLLGYARERDVRLSGREVKGEDLVHYLGHWQTKYEATLRGVRAWRAASARERYGYPEYASMKREAA